MDRFDVNDSPGLMLLEFFDRIEDAVELLLEPLLLRETDIFLLTDVANDLRDAYGYVGK